MGVEISIIVPVYNVEKYLDKCLKSILNQTFQNFEIILVDDGSVDASGNICDTYKNEKIKVIHKPNGGLSSARNAGLNIAEGNYIGFVDSDDFIAPTMLEKMYNNAMGYSADISECGVEHVFPGRNIRQKQREIIFFNNSIKAIEDLWQCKYTTLGVTDKLFHRRLFQTVRFPEGKINEDIFILPQLYLGANGVVCDSVIGYYYNHRENSITTDNFSIKDMDILDACKETEEILCRYDELVSVCRYRRWWSIRGIVNKVAKSTKEVRRENQHYLQGCVADIRKDIIEILKSPYLFRYQRAAFLLLAIYPDLYMLLYNKIREV
ncbi:MAG: glycosyltransferase family 2 protein [[Clostridium] symbiosum]